MATECATGLGIREDVIDDEIVVDYSLSLFEMVQAGHYNLIQPEVVNGPFNISGSGQVVLRPRLIYFARGNIPVEIIQCTMRLMNRRPAKIEELLAFGAKFPKLQMNFPIVGLGSRFDRAEGFYPCLYETSLLRGVCIEPDYEWVARYRFLSFKDNINMP